MRRVHWPTYRLSGCRAAEMWGLPQHAIGACFLLIRMRPRWNVVGMGKDFPMCSRRKVGQDPSEKIHPAFSGDSPKNRGINNMFMRQTRCDERLAVRI